MASLNKKSLEDIADIISGEIDRSLFRYIKCILYKLQLHKITKKSENNICQIFNFFNKGIDFNNF